MSGAIFVSDDLVSKETGFHQTGQTGRIGQTEQTAQMGQTGQTE